MAAKYFYTVKQDGEQAIDALLQTSSLSKAKLKDAMNKGAVHLLRRGKTQRLRRATASLYQGDTLQLFYDEDLLSRKASPPQLYEDFRRYSLWYKPAGVLAQGNEWGDHCAMARLVELHFNHQRKVFIVHRLDREARGLMLIAHDDDAAAKLSQLFQTKNIEKTYQVKVRGELPESGVIEQSLDGKSAVTRFTRHAYNADSNCSFAKVTIESGRKHQIRRHFDSIQHPVMGDPLYGRHNHDDNGLQLVAMQLRFRCPILKREQYVELSIAERLF